MEKSILISLNSSITIRKKTAKLPPIEEVRTLLHHSVRGFLSTLSQEHHGYPFGSMVDFASDAYGSPIIDVSNLAPHARTFQPIPNAHCLWQKISTIGLTLLIRRETLSQLIKAVQKPFGQHI